MIPVTGFAGRRVAVFGLAGSGLATARALLAGGARIACWDDDPRRVEDAANAGLPTGDLSAADFAGFDALVLAPGVPLTHPAPHWTVEKARAAGIEIVGDIELFDRERRARYPDTRLVGITGTNGKSTVTAMIGHLLPPCGLAAQVGGNIGRPVLDLDPPAPGEAVVVECSSFQIDLAPSLAPTVGVHLNLSPDHLDRHGDFASYAAIKERLVAASEIAVVGVDDEPSRAIADRLEARGKRVVRVSAGGPLPRGIFARASELVLVDQDGETPLASLDGIASLRGRHNAQNAAAALAAAMALGLDPKRASAALASFPGLPHRLEEVGRREGVLFVNDSKATNAESARQALSSFDRIYWIAGGRAKTGGIDALADLFPRIARAYLVGEAAEAFAGTLRGHVETRLSGTIDAALVAAAADAGRDPAPEKVVLLSPACASFDQFSGYEARGDHFRRLVKRILEADRRVA